MSTIVSNEILKSLPIVDRPLLAKGIAVEWPAVKKWNVNYLSNHVIKELKFQMGRRNILNTQWECESEYVVATIKDFKEWTENNSSTENPFNNYPVGEWWAYAGYLHFKECEALEYLNEDITWNKLLPVSNNHKESTFWLGTSQSNTACHYDTYGVNFILQIFGRKRWILFPPTDSPLMYPTRIPFEESTVFSEVNFANPNFNQHSKFLSTEPTEIVLEPGDVLYVPRHWWHFVESKGETADITCAVNFWLDQPLFDDRERCKEAISQLLSFSFMHCSSEPYLFQKLNLPERELANTPDWFQKIKQYLIMSVLACQHKSPETEFELSKCQKLTNLVWEIIPPTSIATVFPKLLKSEISPSKISFSECIIKACLDPDVIDLILHKLIKQLKR